MLGKVILITGATSGIGYKTAEYLAAQGNIVYGGRRIESLENIKQVNPLKLDLTNEASIKTAIDTIIANEGRIDVLVNNLVMVHMVQSKMSQLKKRNSNLK